MKHVTMVIKPLALLSLPSKTIFMKTNGTNVTRHRSMHMKKMLLLFFNSCYQGSDKSAKRSRREHVRATKKHE